MILADFLVFQWPSRTAIIRVRLTETFPISGGSLLVVKSEVNNGDARRAEVKQKCSETIHSRFNHNPLSEYENRGVKPKIF